MKKVIHGIIYDTNAEKVVASHIIQESSTKDYGSSISLQETLYRKKTGEFFLDICLFAFVRNDGNKILPVSFSPNGSIGILNRDIFPLNEEQATEWVQVFYDTDNNINQFGEVEE